MSLVETVRRIVRDEISALRAQAQQTSTGTDSVTAIEGAADSWQDVALAQGGPTFRARPGLGVEVGDTVRWETSGGLRHIVENLSRAAEVPGEDALNNPMQFGGELRAVVARNTLPDLPSPMYPEGTLLAHTESGTLYRNVDDDWRSTDELRLLTEHFGPDEPLASYPLGVSLLPLNATATPAWILLPIAGSDDTLVTVITYRPPSTGPSFSPVGFQVAYSRGSWGEATRAYSRSWIASANDWGPFSTEARMVSRNAHDGTLDPFSWGDGVTMMAVNDFEGGETPAADWPSGAGFVINLMSWGDGRGCQVWFEADQDRNAVGSGARVAYRYWDDQGGGNSAWSDWIWSGTHTHASAAEGGTVAHSATTGLTADDHTQYVLHESATAQDIDNTAGGEVLHTRSTGAVVQSGQRFAAAAGAAANFTLDRSRNATLGSHTAVQSGDTLSNLSLRGSDGTDFQTAAQMQGVVDGTVGSGDVPGAIVFRTKPAGSAITERMRISSAGRVILSGSAGPQIVTGTGTPEGAITAPVGSLFLRTDGGASTTLYVKESGTGNTGWAGK